MDQISSIEALSALAQPTRLEAFRQLDVPQNTLSSHLSILAKAGLVRGERQSRSIIYRADLERFREVMLFLLSDCCNGHPLVCAPVRDSLTSICQPGKEACC